MPNYAEIKDSRMFRCYTFTLAVYLVDRGFKIMFTKPKYDQPNKNVFYFAKSDKLIKAVEEYNVMKQHVLDGDELTKEEICFAKSYGFWKAV